MESRPPLDCSIFDLAGKEWKVPHKFVHGCCVRCGEPEKRAVKVTKPRFSGKSNSINKYNNYL